jgi:cytochrome c
MRAAIALLFAAIASHAMAATGQDLFNSNCADCHALDPAAGQSAPPLKGVVGRAIASVAGFPYSDALKAKTGTWTAASLDAFLADPQAFAPGTQMFGGEPDPADRKAIIDYLTSVK